MADLQFDLFQAELMRSFDASKIELNRDHDRRWFGLMCYWYSSLNVVVEAWEELELQDSTVNFLLSRRDLRNFLKRFRNGVFHYQPTPLSHKITDLIKTSPNNANWVILLHFEILRFSYEYLDRMPETNEEKLQLRNDTEEIVDWYPPKETPRIDRLQKTIDEALKISSNSQDETSREYSEVQEAIKLAQEVIKDARCGLKTLKSDLLNSFKNSYCNFS